MHHQGQDLHPMGVLVLNVYPWLMESLARLLASLFFLGTTLDGICICPPSVLF